MMDQNSIIESGGFYFIHNFDSGNLGHVERVPTDRIAPCQNHKLSAPEVPDYEFNMWTRPDCAGTEFENGNRTWFYFGIQAPQPGLLVRLNLINLNKQGKMYNQGMAPVTRTLPGKPQWERIRDRPIHSMDDNTFTLTFKYRTPENPKATTFFAFTYPFSFAELQIALNSIDLKMLPLPSPHCDDDIYYHRECLVYSLEGRRVDLLTITSFHGILNEREERLKNLFPDKMERARKFANKKVIFISARVHPGETPSSFVFNGFLNLILTKHDPIAIQLRKLYVFKMIPFLNPDGVARGHYRTDTRGVNLNRVYLNPSIIHHPTVFASRALIRYYHFGTEKEDTLDDTKSYGSHSVANISECSESTIDPKKKRNSSSSYRHEASKRQSDKSVSSKTNKSSTTIKASSSRNLRDSKAASTSVVDENERKLVEMPSQTSDLSCKSSSPNLRDGSDSLLNESTLRSCLGSNVHLSTSEELNMPGSNPLQPLRDTLKNSISLLLESSSSVGGDSSMGAKESRAGHVFRTGLCFACRAAITRMEDTMPGIASLLPGYNDAVQEAVSPTPSPRASARGSKYQMSSASSQRSTLLNLSEKRPRSASITRSIDEYREVQRIQLEQEQERKLLESQQSPPPLSRFKDDDVYFCTNCFKKYDLKEDQEKISNPLESSTSVGVSCIESGDGKQVCSLMDAKIGAPSKEEKSKSQSASRLPRKKTPTPAPPAPRKPSASADSESGLYLYIDLHGHASKKGIFMYGNHFDDAESCVECMLLPRIMSLNNLHFHFSSCNFTERNMYLKDRRDGMSREGSGRVAVLKATGLVRSYTLECNYNTGRLVNVLPPAAKDTPHTVPATPPAPPKYTPHIFEEVGRSLGASILDLTGQHPNSRIPCSEHRNLSSVREWLRCRTKTRPLLTMSRLRPNISSPNRAPLYQRSCKKAPEERKENTFVCARAELERPPALPAPRSPHEMASTRFPKKPEPVKSTSRTRYLTENEPKVKTITAKRRNVLAIRKPNSKTQISGGIVKAKVSRRSIEESESPRVMSANISKRSFARGTVARRNRCRAMASSSSEEIIGGTWEEVAGGTALGSAHDTLAASKRRQYPPPAVAHLKKIRLKTNM